ncbi:hypothetical protein CGRA01v4_14548 [Colletotrichum graminicola]|nr:hypothetical protein CGRA01v4_14548 [Colletotrichum graminicola]
MTFSFFSNHLPFRVRRTSPSQAPFSSPRAKAIHLPLAGNPQNIPYPPTETAHNEIQRERGQRCENERKPTHEQHPPGRLGLSHVGSRTHTPLPADYAVEASQRALWNGRVTGNPGAAHWFQSLWGFMLRLDSLSNAPPFLDDRAQP